MQKLTSPNRIIEERNVTVLVLRGGLRRGWLEGGRGVCAGSGVPGVSVTRARAAGPAGRLLVCVREVVRQPRTCLVLRAADWRK